LRKIFKPVELKENERPSLRPLFTGRVADMLDRVTGEISSLFGLLSILGGLGVLAYFMVTGGYVFAMRGAWLSLAALVGSMFAFGFVMWVSSMVTRLILLSILALSALAGFSVLARVLS